jgi:hypothetical protein
MLPTNISDEQVQSLAADFDCIVGHFSFTILKQLNQIIRQCLWSKKDVDSCGHSLASCEIICKQKEKSGLGIMDFQKQNEGLLMKHLPSFIIRRLFLGCSLYGSITHMKFPMLQSYICGSFLVERYYAVG